MWDEGRIGRVWFGVGGALESGERKMVEKKGDASEKAESEEGWKGRETNLRTRRRREIEGGGLVFERFEERW